VAGRVYLKFHLPGGYGLHRNADIFAQPKGLARVPANNQHYRPFILLQPKGIQFYVAVQSNDALKRITKRFD
jgi:hypothetical protein